jgi:hypothetical protein
VYVYICVANKAMGSGKGKAKARQGKARQGNGEREGARLSEDAESFEKTRVRGRRCGSTRQPLFWTHTRRWI